MVCFAQCTACEIPTFCAGCDAIILGLQAMCCSIDIHTGCAQVISGKLCVQDAYWTTGRSVLLGDSNKLHPAKKHMAIDGRIRCCPTKDRAFAMFWAITRTQVERYNF